MTDHASGRFSHLKSAVAAGLFMAVVAVGGAAALTLSSEIPVAHAQGGSPEYSPQVSSAFTDTSVVLPWVSSGTVAWGDYDSDGDLDLLLAGFTGASSARVYRNDGNGSFTDVQAGLVGVYYSSAAWGDYDNDGDLDILLAGWTGSGSVTKIYRNDGAGGFVDISAPLVGVHLGSVAWADYDNDGALDVLVAGTTSAVDWTCTSPTTKLYRNNGHGSFTEVSAGLVPVACGSAAWGDYDKNGRLDLLLTGDTGSGNYVSKLYRNDGGGVFTEQATGLTGVRDSSMAWGDYDNDGDLDIVLAGATAPGGAFGCASPISKVYRNDGNASFTNIAAPLTSTACGSAVWGDYDNDGRLDILLTGSSAAGASSQVYHNDGGGVFTNIGVSMIGAMWSSAAWGDYDNDGKLDIIVTGSTLTQRTGALYRNTGLVANTPPTAPRPLAVQVTGTRFVLSWQPASDGQTPAAGLSYNLRLGTTPGGVDAVSPMAAGTGYRRLSALGNAQVGVTATLELLTGTTYYWSLQAVDTAFAGSAFADEVRFTEKGITQVSFGSSSPDWVGQTTIFTNTSVMSGSTSYAWDFGDGNFSSAESPTHQYVLAGTYTVVLTATNPANVVSSTQDVSVFSSPAADFVATPISGVRPLQVSFTAAVTTTPYGDPLLTHAWDFGDGSTSVIANPIHVYTVASVYTVSLVVSNPAGQDGITRSSFITVSPMPAVAVFSGTPLSGYAPLTVAFTNNSSGDYTDVLWSFGDGLTSTAVSPSHTYLQAGSYPVSLTVSGPGGTDAHVLGQPVVVRAAVYLPLVMRNLAPPTPTPTATGTPTHTPTPTMTPTPTPFPRAAMVAIGLQHSCALTVDGAVKCWGGNESGQLGDGSGKNSNTPVTAAGLSSNVVSIAAGVWHTCALLGTGVVKCWGANWDGQLGDGSVFSRTTPVGVIGLGEPAVAISAGMGHTCAVIGSGAVKCWGRNDYGQLGDGTTTYRTTPGSVVGLGTGGKIVAAGGYHTCAVTDTGSAKCWGRNDYGQLGYGPTSHAYTPVDVYGLASAVMGISAGQYSSCAVTESGAARCWGQHDSLGDTTCSSWAPNYEGCSLPVPVYGMGSGTTAVSCGLAHACGMNGFGELYCWGSNLYGQLGDGTTEYRYRPVAVSGLATSTYAAVGGLGLSCAVTSSGAVMCWGGGYGLVPVYMVGFGG